MATRIAQANTANNNVWSSTLTWQGGIVPLPGDDVVANGITVNVDGVFTVNTLRNDTVLGGVVGGTFNLLNGSVMNTTGTTGLFVGNNILTPVLTFNLASPNSASYNGNVITMNINTPSGSGGKLIQYNSSGTFNITGNFNIDSGAASVVRSVIYISGSGKVNILGNLTNSVTGGNNVQTPLFIASAATVDINVQTLTGGNVAINNTTPAIYCNAAATLIISCTSITGAISPAIFTNGGATCTITTTVITGNASVPAILNQTNAATFNITSALVAGTNSICVNSLTSVNVIGNVTVPAGGNASAISTPGSVTVTGNVITNGNNVAINCGGLATINGLIFNNQQWQGVFAPRILIGTATTAMRYQTFAGATQLMFSSSSITLGLPTPNNVRKDTDYGLAPDVFTGTCVIPAPNTVVLGAPTDNTVGTLQMSPAAVIQELETSTLDIAVRLRNVSTVQTMGEQSATYGI